MNKITEKIQACLFQDGSFLYKNELQIPNGTKLDNAILQIEKVIPILCLNVQILFFYLFFRFFLDWIGEQKSLLSNVH